jgi:dolichol-phosphate mannosyltransferase
MQKISFVIPVYQNQGSLFLTAEKIITLFKTQLKKYAYEIIFIDDGSTDFSLKELLNIRKKNRHVKVITFTRNFGQMAAILAGFKEAKGNAIVNISADLQDPVVLIPAMVDKWKNGSEIVACSRQDRDESLSRKIVSKFAYKLIKQSIPLMPPGGFDYFLMDKKVLGTFNSSDTRHRYFQGELLWSGYKVSFIPYTREKRKIGKSQYNFSRKLKVFFDAILDGSYWPIRLMSSLGALIFLMGIVYSILISITWANGGTPFKGWAPLMIVLLLSTGLIMLMLGVVGEYIWRISEEVKKRPYYVIRNKFL